MERIGQLGEQAAERIERLGYTNVHIHNANGTLGLPQEAPFDAIIVTAGAAAIPRPYVDQLRLEAGGLSFLWETSQPARICIE